MNIEKLDAELRAAGIPINSCRDGEPPIDFRAEATQQHRDQAAAILAAHDPAPTLAQRLRAVGFTLREAALFLVIRELRGGAPAPAWAAALLSQAATQVDNQPTEGE